MYASDFAAAAGLFIHTPSVVGEVVFRFLGRSVPAPMTAPVPFGMNSSSSQLLDMLQALRLGHFFKKIPSLTSRLPIKKSIRLPKHFKLQLPTSTPPKTLNLIVTQTLSL
jgi:hypothetical protein